MTCSDGWDDGTGRCNGGCASGYHDDGGRVCVPLGCLAGYHDGGYDAGNGACLAGITGSCSGTCVPIGVCSSRFHDDGTGTCVHSGCAAGYHDGGYGTCVAIGTCASGYHDGGNGTCVARGTCVAGYHNNGTGNCAVDVTLQSTEYQVTSDVNGHSTPVIGQDAIGDYIVYTQYPIVNGMEGNSSIFYQRVASGQPTGSPVPVAESSAESISQRRFG